ncbi:MAG: FecR domain-containing protein, partial [Blastocatellia bacterium]
MKPTFVFPIVVILLASTGIAFAQNRTSADPANSRQFLVSARAGGVNVADGDVTVKKDQADWQMVVVGDNLDAGQRLRTGPDSRAEILLNPGSYLRANENSELAFDSVALDDLKVRLIQGSVIVEATAVKGLDTRLLTVVTADSSFDIRRAGIYRFSVSANGKAQAEVFKGRLTVDGTEVKDGKKVDVDGATPLVSAFDSKDLDSFEVWSKDRAKSLI